MRIAITGGTGFVGGHLGRSLVREGHEVVFVARGMDRRDEAVRRLAGSRFAAADVGDEEGLVRAFEGCGAIAHCAGINRETGRQSYWRVHVEGTRAVVRAAQRAGAGKVVLLSFLRARPGCGMRYHESKWKAEEIVRTSGLDYTILKSGVIYGIGDHMLDHLSRAFHTFPLFGLVGFRDKPVAPLAIEDLLRILKAGLVEGRLSRQTIAIVGPERLTLGDAVRRVAAATGRNPSYIRLPIALHRVLGWIGELVMKIPLVSSAQVNILSEGVVDPVTAVDGVPPDLAPRIRFGLEEIRWGLPPPGPFTVRDLRCALTGT
jgi:NADH dehydrogenase